jgi:hypothetical protein
MSEKSRKAGMNAGRMKMREDFDDPMELVTWPFPERLSESGETTTLGSHELVERFDEVLARIAGGGRVFVQRDTDPGQLFQLYLKPAEEEKSERILGLHPGAMIASDDFDDPLPDHIWSESP